MSKRPLSLVLAAILTLTLAMSATATEGNPDSVTPESAETEASNITPAEATPLGTSGIMTMAATPTDATTTIEIDGIEYEVDFTTGGNTATVTENGITVTATIEGAGTWVSLGSGEGIEISFALSGTVIEDGNLNISIRHDNRSSSAGSIPVRAGEDASSYAVDNYVIALPTDAPNRLSLELRLNLVTGLYALANPTPQTSNGVTFHFYYSGTDFAFGKPTVYYEENYPIHPSCTWMGTADESGSYTFTLSSQKANFSDSITLPVEANKNYGIYSSVGLGQGFNGFSMPATAVDDLVFTVNFTAGEYVPLVEAEITATVKYPGQYGGTSTSTMYGYVGYKLGNWFFLNETYSDNWPEEDGYTFLGYFDNAGNLLTENTIITGDTTFNGRWQENQAVTPPTNNGNNDNDDDQDDDDSGSSYSGSRDSSTPSAPSNAPQTVTATTATNAANSAITAAQAAGQATATANIRNPGNISLATLNAMSRQAGDMPLKLQADSMTAGNTAVDVRITIDPAQATAAINLSASTISTAAKSTVSFFERYFSNDIMTVALGQQGSFGMAVEIAAKLEPTLNTQNLVFYSYNRETNSYTQITDPVYWVDANGYVHFKTTLGGSIIISDGRLAKK